MQGFGRMLVIVGLLLLLGGGLVMLASRLGLPLGRLPGDVAIRGKRFAFYAPVATCLILSLLFSLLLWIFHSLRR